MGEASSNVQMVPDNNRLYARDTDIWQLRQGTNPPQRITKKQDLLYTPNEQKKSREMAKMESSGRDSGQFNTSGTISISEIDTEAVKSSVEDGPEDSSTWNGDHGEWLSIEKEQMRIQEQGWSKLHKEEINQSMTGIVSGRLAAEARLRKEIQLEELRHKIRAQLGFTHRGLEHKDAEITVLHSSMANARAEEEKMGRTAGYAK